MLNVYLWYSKLEKMELILVGWMAGALLGWEVLLSGYRKLRGGVTEEFEVF